VILSAQRESIPTLGSVETSATPARSCFGEVVTTGAHQWVSPSRAAAQVSDEARKAAQSGLSGPRVPTPSRCVSVLPKSVNETRISTMLEGDMPYYRFTLQRASSSTAIWGQSISTS
jgi:hypothetical protein